MTQIFSSTADTLLRLVLVGFVVAVCGGMTAIIGFARSDYYTSAHIHPPPQPVPFSHRHHVSGLGLDCRYCHSAFEDSPRAGLPPTETCMTCHSQIWTGAPMLAAVRESLARHAPLVWNRVARLPDYVYFRHDIHVAKGVGCVTCHGRIDQMALSYREKPLTMGFCLDCHRDPAPKLRPWDRITDMTWKADDARALGNKLAEQAAIRIGRITDCDVCHR
jgi:hypothetical protein